MRNAGTAVEVEDINDARDCEIQPCNPEPVVLLAEATAVGRYPNLMSASAVPDMPAAIGIMVIASYVALILIFIVGFASTRDMIVNLGVIMIFMTMFFAIPWLFLGVEPGGLPRPTLDQFMRQGMETATGHCSGRAALVQILIVPVFLTGCALAMGVVAAIVL